MKENIESTVSQMVANFHMEREKYQIKINNLETNIQGLENIEHKDEK